VILNLKKRRLKKKKLSLLLRLKVLLYSMKRDQKESKR
jgi:hypothetical protein